MKRLVIFPILLSVIPFCLTACEHGEAHEEHAEHKIVVTSPKVKDVIITQPYVCQIHSRKHIEVCALESGYLQAIRINEGQTVKKDDLMFQILPTLHQAKLDAEKAEAKLAEIEFVNTKNLYESTPPVVSIQEVKLYQAKLDKANAKAQLALAEKNFTSVKAPFDGIVDRLHEQLGSLIKEGEVLTTLSDNSVMWVYFNVPEAKYLDYMTGREQEDPKIELKLANGTIFPQTGKIGAIEANFNNETGNIAFRADFENPKRLLRHGQTGSVLLHRTLKDAVVIPQRAVFEILDKRYVFVIGEDETVHQREITIQHEMDDIFVISKGLDAKEKIVLEGVRQVRDGDKVEYEFREPEEALANQKFHAE